jgi:predicted ATPase/class 3 adenylate cyclase
VAICPNCGEENPDKFRLCGFCGTPLAPAAPPQEVRKTVTIVFSDLKGSTAMAERLDSEAVREVMSRYFDEMRGALERHGGTIEKYIGDAIMAVFGLPRVHEDDALRAVRAAAEMRDRLAMLNEELESRWGVTIGNRTGVNTGEVVAGDPTTGQRLVTGDTVNTAARLEQAAPECEVLIGEPTYRLVRHAVEVEAVEPLELKGKAERVPAYRLLQVRDAESVERRHDRALVGRAKEMSVLTDALAATVEEGSCRLVTFLAQAGVGKSRLIEEFTRVACAQAEVVRGRCLPYGRGITFWPLVEIFREAARIRDDDPPAEARRKLAELAGPNLDEAVDRVASAIGFSDSSFSLDEVFWGTRKLFEAQAARRPLVVVFDDIHWAESALLDLIEHVATSASGAPLLLVCAARPDLLELRPAWVERDSPLLELQPLTPEETALVVEQLLEDAVLPTDVRERIVDVSEGNPLFAEQILSMLIEDGALRPEAGVLVAEGEISELAIPATIHALLEARLDRLSPQERSVIEPAAVIGLMFEERAVRELAPETVRPAVSGHLATMTKKQLVLPQADQSELDYRFHHILIRDAAYGAILKRARATLHERFADWAEAVNRERDRETQFEEILGYHLEQAYSYLSELGPLDDHGQKLGLRAARKLGAAGRRAFARGDTSAAANLLRRAVQVLPGEHPERLELLPDAGEAMMEIGEFAWAEIFLDEALQGAIVRGDERLRAEALLTRLLVRHHATEDLDGWRAEVQRETAELIPILEERNAHAELAKAWRMVAFVHGIAIEWEQTAKAQQNAIRHARLAGKEREEARMSGAYSMALCTGPTAVREAIERCEEILDRGLSHQQSQALVFCSLATLYAMDGEFDQARELYRRARALLDDLAAVVLAASTSLTSGRVETFAGDLAAAERELRRDYEQLLSLGELYYRPLVAAALAQALYGLGRLDEADELATAAADIAAEDDIEAQAICRSVRAKIVAERGATEEGVALAREAVLILAPTDDVCARAEALLDLVAVLVRAGDHDEAARVAEEAAELCRLKGMTVLAERVEQMLATLREGSLPQSA